MTVLRTRLEPAALEAELRGEGLARDRRMASGLILVAIVFLIATIPDMFVPAAAPANLHLIEAIRIGDLLAAGTALVLVHRVDRPQVYDWILTVWIGIWFVGIVAENALLPAAMTDYVMWDVFLSIAVYAAVPLPLPRQAALAAVLSCGDLLVLWKFKSPGPFFSMLDVTLAFACANAAGVFVSRERHGWRRRAFLAFREEVAARAELQAALSEVKTLQGILPICSHCKKVRTEAGNWQQIEAYVHAHSDADFSHGVCPDCLRLHYPDFADG